MNRTLCAIECHQFNVLAADAKINDLPIIWAIKWGGLN